MAFCSKCGRQLEPDAHFCSGCGASVEETAHQSSSNQRKEVWEGSVHKCPNCGASVGSFEAYCPACGNELRDKDAARSVSELSRKLDLIESERGKGRKKKSRFAKASEQNTINDIDQRKVSLIRTFPIPNTVEDILEFVILASSNVDPKVYSPLSTDASRKAVSDAWLSKCDQAIHKAEVSFSGNPLVDSMRTMLGDARKNVKRAKVQGAFQFAMIFVGPILLIVLICVVSDLANPTRNADEINRLEGIVSDIEQDLENGEYYRALLNAESLDPASYLSSEEQRQWEVNREYWIDRVIDEAAENGVDLSDEASELDIGSSSSEEDQSGGFVSGFMNGLESGLGEAQENIDEFNRIMSGANDGINEQQGTQ